MMVTLQFPSSNKTLLVHKGRHLQGNLSSLNYGHLFQPSLQQVLRRAKPLNTARKQPLVGRSLPPLQLSHRCWQSSSLLPQRHKAFPPNLRLPYPLHSRALQRSLPRQGLRCLIWQKEIPRSLQEVSFIRIQQLTSTRSKLHRLT